MRGFRDWCGCLGAQPRHTSGSECIGAKKSPSPAGRGLGGGGNIPIANISEL